MYQKLHFALENEINDGYEILEGGAGTGLISLEIAQKFRLKRLCVMDVREDLLNKAKENFLKHSLKTDRKNIFFEKGDLQNLKYPDSSFDLVFNEGVIEHIGDMEKGVKEMVRVSRNKVMIFIPNYYNPLWRILKAYLRRKGKFYLGADEYGYEKDITHRAIIKWLKEAGIREIRLFELGYRKLDLIFPLILKQNIGILGMK